MRDGTAEHFPGIVVVVGGDTDAGEVGFRDGDRVPDDDALPRSQVVQVDREGAPCAVRHTKGAGERRQGWEECWNEPSKSGIVIFSAVREINRNWNQKNDSFSIPLIPILVPIPPKCAKMAKEPESRFLRNRNRLSTSLEEEA